MIPAAAAGSPPATPPAGGEPTAAAAGPISSGRFNRSFATHWMGACLHFAGCAWCEIKRRVLEDYTGGETVKPAGTA